MFGNRDESAGCQTNVTTLHEHLCLATVSNQQVVDQSTPSKWFGTRLAAAPNQPVAKLSHVTFINFPQFGNRDKSPGSPTRDRACSARFSFGHRDKSPGSPTAIDDKAEGRCLVTVANNPVVQYAAQAASRQVGLATESNTGIPVSTTQDGVPRPTWISAGVNSRPNGGTVCFSSQGYDTATTAYTGNSNMRLVLCHSNDGSGMNVYLFGCRVVSPDRPAGEIAERSLSWFGRRAESAGSQTTLPPSRTMFCLATGSNVGVPVSTTQDGRFPVRCGSPQAWIPAPTAVFKAILPLRRANACPPRGRFVRRCPFGRAPSRTRGSAS